MKKIMSIFIICAILVMGPIGCSNLDAKENNYTPPLTTYESVGKVDRMVKDETITGTLRVQMHDELMWKENLDRIEKTFHSYYPNVKLKLKPSPTLLTYEQYEHYWKELLVEIMSGEGPDIISFSSTFDLYKLMKAGVFADLSTYFRDDTNFNIEDYAANVLYAGQFNGKQYIVPLRFGLPMLFSTESILKDTGFQIDKCNDLISTEKELLRVFKNSPFDCEPKEIAAGFVTPYLFLFQGDNSWVDYYNNTVDLKNNKEIKEQFEILKELRPYLNIDYQTGILHGCALLDMGIENVLSEKKAMFYQPEGYIDIRFLNAYRILKERGENPVYFPIKNMTGKQQAYIYQAVGVNNASKNIPAAYNFIKMLISPEFNMSMISPQYNPMLMSGFPLCRAAFEQYLKTYCMKNEVLDMYMGNGNKAAALAENEIEDIINTIYSIDCAHFETLTVYEVMKKMSPYLTGNKSYEECIEEAENYAIRYISE